MEVGVRRTKRQSNIGVIGGSSSSGVYSAEKSSSSSRRSFGSSLGYSSGSSSKKVLPTTLSLYSDPPNEEITIDQFERSGFDRLQALKSCEALRVKKGVNVLAKSDVDHPVDSIIKQCHLDELEWDLLSHHVLRLAYCRTEELRRWLLTQECHLFKHRFDNEKEENIKAFLKENKMNYEPLEDIDIDLLTKLRSVPFADPKEDVYYRVPFEEAFDLIKDRKVYLEAGFAYVSKKNLSSIITAKFRAHLSHSLSITFRATSHIEQDERIVPIVSMLSKQYVTAAYKTAKIEGAVTKEQIPALADRSFPLCMSHLYKSLKDENHLRHGGRMQFGLYLKGIGLSLQDALIFWKTAFARRTAPEKFDKEYAYNIRHNYGKEGKRTTYTPYGCIKIIQSTPGPGDHHGCPFRQFDEAHLRSTLRLKKVTQQAIDEIMALVKNNHYQIACQRYFAATHNGIVPETVGNHPNSYFDASEKYFKDLQAGVVKPEQNADGSSSSSSSSSSSGEGSTANETTATATAAEETTTKAEPDAMDVSEQS